MRIDANGGQWLRSLLCIWLGLALSAAAPAEVQRITWQGEVAKGGLVRVVNPFGDVRARFGGYEGRLEVFATVQHFPEEGAPLLVQGEPSEVGVDLTVGYRRGPGGALVTERDPAQRKRVDLVVFVPEGVSLSLRSDQGLIEVKGVRGDVAAQTSGALSARGVRGRLDFVGSSGDALVFLEADEGENAISISTETGDITLSIPDDAHVSAELATAGWISTDFSLRVETERSAEAGKRATAVVGKGTRPLSVSSIEGHLRLVRRPAANRAKAGRAVQ